MGEKFLGNRADYFLTEHSFSYYHAVVVFICFCISSVYDHIPPSLFICLFPSNPSSLLAFSFTVHSDIKTGLILHTIFFTLRAKSCSVFSDCSAPTLVFKQDLLESAVTQFKRLKSRLRKILFKQYSLPSELEQICAMYKKIDILHGGSRTNLRSSLN